MKYCYHCGQALADDYEFCPICGKNVPPVGSLFPTAAPSVYAAEPLHVYSTSARVLTGLSKGLGIPALVLSIIASLPLFSWVLSGDVSAESDPNVLRRNRERSPPREEFLESSAALCVRCCL